MTDKRSDRKTRVFLTGSFLAALTVLAVVIALITLFSGWNPTRAWPLLLTATGLSGLYAGLVRSRRFTQGYIVPSLIFIALSGVFSLFSFNIIPTRLGDFVLMYWPLILLAGTLLVLGIWQYSLYRKRKHTEKEGEASK